MVLEKPQDIGADGNFDAVASSTSMDATMDALGLSEKPEQILDSLKDIQETINSTLRDLKDLVDELNGYSDSGESDDLQELRSLQGILKELQGYVDYLNNLNTQISHNISFINQYGIRNGSKDKLKQEAFYYQVSLNFIKDRLPELKKAVQDWENEHQWNTLVRGLQEDLSRLQDENDMLRKKIQEMEDVEEQRQRAENSRIEEEQRVTQIIETGGNFSEITSLTRKQADMLIQKYDGHSLGLFGLTELDESVAEKLAQFKGSNLSIDAPNIDIGVAEKLAQFKGSNLSIYAPNIDVGVAEKLAQFKGSDLSIHTPNIDIGVAEKLREFKGKYLYLGVQTLDEETAKILLSSDSKYEILLPDDIILEGQNISNILRGSKRVTY